MNESKAEHRVVIIGAGFGGLFAARELGRSGFQVTLLDKRNFHLFQPLLYQVATGGLSPDDICTPLRPLFHRRRNVAVRLGTAYDIDPDRKIVFFEQGELHYDTLIAATGVKHDYFGNDQWRKYAPGLKTVEHALEMRRRIFSAFELAENEPDEQRRRALLTFVVVGGGPTGVELAGSLAEVAHHTMVDDFRNIDPREARVVLVEGLSQVLPPYRPSQGAAAKRALENLGVEVLTDTMVSAVESDKVSLHSQGKTETLPTHTVLWAAGVKTSLFGQILARRTGAELGSAGKLRVAGNLRLLSYPDIYVIGDLANVAQSDGSPVPWVAPAAIQQGRYVARHIAARHDNQRAIKPFRYRDRGKMAVIGRRNAVADLKWMTMKGFPAWCLWVVIHIWALIEAEQRFRVMGRWIWKYFTRHIGDRFITGDPPDSRQIRTQKVDQEGQSVTVTTPGLER